MKIDKTGLKLSSMSKPVIIGFALIILFSACPLRGQQEIILEHSDSSRLRMFDDSIMTYLFGNVHLRQGDAEIFADSVFYSSTGNYQFMGNIRFLDSARSITTQYLIFSESENLYRAFGQSHLEDMSENMILDGDSVYFDDRAKILTVTGRPHVVFNADDPRSMIDVDCDSLRFYSEDNYGEAYRNVKIIKGSLYAQSGKAMLMPDSNFLSLSIKPVAYQSSNTVSGDSMSIYLKDDLIDYIDIDSNAHAVYKQASENNDTLFTESKLDAKKITFFFEEEELSQIVSAGNSYSEYIPVSGDSLVSGRNVASGDSIKLYFDQRNLNDVEIITSCEGSYYSNQKTDSLGNIIEEDTIDYNADHLLYKIKEHVINLYGNSQVGHKAVSLESDTIFYDTDSRIVRAESYWEYPEGGDSVFHPVVLRESSDVIYGERLAYNVDTRRGKIKASDTKMDEAYYHGNIIRKEEDDVLFVNGGRYTTCDLKEPHFHFYSNNMKLITDDRVVARPVILYIDRIPVFYLPYFVFSIKKERHSGFLSFQIGNFERGSRFVNNLGYYWALSDYYDLETSIDYNDEVGVTFNLGVNYALRYKFSGSVEGSYARETDHDLSGQTKRNRWQLSFSHKQTISETASLNGSGDFISDASYYTDVSTDLDERLDRSIRSQVNFIKSWGRASLTAAVEGTNNLDTDNTTYSLPRLTFSLPSRALFSSDDSENKHWYQNLMYTYRVNSNNYITNTGSGDDRTSRHYATTRHSISLSMPTNILTYLTISPNASIYENWFYIFETDQSSEKGLLSETGLRRADLSFGMSASTKIYGLFRPPISGLVGLRHVLTPSADFTFKPKSVRHADEASYVGIGSGGSESQTLGLSLGNLFQIKYKSAGVEKKMDLFTLNFSASYNFKSESYKWSDLTTTMRSSSIPYLTFSLSATHDLYNPETGRLDIWHAHLQTLSLSTSYSASGKGTLLGRKSSSVIGDTLSANPDDEPEENAWSLSIGHRYAETRGSSYTSVTHTLTLGSEFSLTKNWKVGFSQYFNIKSGEITERTLSFYRDMHCWEASFTWIPNGSRKGYYFCINVKDIPDIKFEKSESGISSPLSDQFSF